MEREPSQTTLCNPHITPVDSKTKPPAAPQTTSVKDIGLEFKDDDPIEVRAAPCSQGL
jgi:hypothetical protein